LNPDFNLFLGLAPFAQTLLAEETSDDGLDFWLNEILEWGRKLIALPARLDATLTRLERGELAVITRVPDGQRRQMDQLNTAINRLTGGIIFVGLLTASTVLFVSGHVQLGIGGWALAGVVLVWVLARIK
jgi:hypothetical protein